MTRPGARNRNVLVDESRTHKPVAVAHGGRYGHMGKFYRGEDTMVRRSTKRRTYWLATGLIMTTMILVGTVAMGIAATTPSSDIILVLDDEASEFQFGDMTQAVSVDESACDVTPDSLDGEIMTISGAIYTKDGSWVSDEVVGFDHGGLGVNSFTRGGREICGLIDSLDANTSDALTMSLGEAVDGQMIESIDFDLDSKGVARVRIDFLDDAGVAFTEYYDLPDDASEINDDPHFHGSLSLTVPQDPANMGSLFDGVRVSMDSRKIAVTGGEAWEDPSMHRTVFHLTEGLPGISVDATTNGTDGDSFLVGEPITWSYLVTNTGDTPLVDVALTDVPLGTISCAATELALGASTTCSLSGTAEAGLFENTGTVTALSPGGVSAEASDSSSYYGLLGCGDSDSNGGPGFVDDPLGAFFNGPTKDEAECGAAVSISTSNTTGSGGDQTVDIAAPPGFVWDGVTGLVTIEWDVELPSDDGIARTLQQVVLGDPLSEIVIPWCESAIGITQAGAPDWWYELDPDTTYPTATGAGDTCLIRQTTETVDIGGVVYTQTTEVFYIWNDPRMLRK